MPFNDELAEEMTDKMPPELPALQPSDDGTRALLQAGFWIMVFGALSLLSTETLFGGIGIDGPHSNAGWLAFMFAMMAIPFALLLLVLGGAKWLRNRRLRRQ